MKFRTNILFIYKLLVSISYAVNNPVGIIRTTLWDYSNNPMGLFSAYEI